MFTEGPVEFVTSCEHLPKFMSSLSGHFTFKIGVICIDDKIP